MSKSPNKHNRLHCNVAPLGDELCKAIDDEEVSAKQDLKVRGKILCD